MRGKRGISIVIDYIIQIILRGHTQIEVPE